MTPTEKINLYKKSVSKTSKKFNIPEKDLLVKVLIDSYRFAEKILKNREFMRNRTETLAIELKKNRLYLDRKYSNRSITKLQKEKCHIRKLEWRTAKEILKNYHHIGSYRRNSLHLGLYYEVEPDIEKLMGIVTFSTYDFFFRPYSIFSNFNSNGVLNLSRLYIFDWAPYNTASCFISKSTNYLQEYYPNIRCLITCINPNTGHQGKTFNACNWTEIGQFTGAPYLYLDSTPITIRALYEKYGTLELTELKKKLGKRLFISDAKILPQKMYMYIINKKSRMDFFSNRIDKVYYFDNYHFSPEFGLTDKHKDSAITYNEAKQKVQNIPNNVIAGYLEKDNSHFYSSIIVKKGKSFSNIRKNLQDNFKINKDRRVTQLKVTNLPKFSNTIIICGDQISSKNIQLKRSIKSDNLDTIIVLSYLQNDFNTLLDSVTEMISSRQVKKVILYDFFNGFHLVRV